MSKFPIMSFRWIFQLLNKIWVFFSYLCNKQFRKVLQYQPVKYDLYPLSPGESSIWRATNVNEKKVICCSVATSPKFGPAKDSRTRSWRNAYSFAPWRSSAEPFNQTRNTSRLHSKLDAKNQFFIHKNLFRVYRALREKKRRKIETFTSFAQPMNCWHLPMTLVLQISSFLPFSGVCCHRPTSRQILCSQATTRRLLSRYCFTMVRLGCVHSEYGDLWCSSSW